LCGPCLAVAGTLSKKARRFTPGQSWRGTTQYRSVCKRPLTAESRPINQLGVYVVKSADMTP
jgi:hypothetical protein